MIEPHQIQSRFADQTTHFVVYHNKVDGVVHRWIFTWHPGSDSELLDHLCDLANCKISGFTGRDANAVARAVAKIDPTSVFAELETKAEDWQWY